MAASKEGGFKMSLGSLKAKANLRTVPSNKDSKRSRLALGEDEPDDTNTRQEILGWDAAEGGALDANGRKEKEAPRVIQALPNRDWQAEARRKQVSNAPHQRVQDNGIPEGVETSKVQHGLTIVRKDQFAEIDMEDTNMAEPIHMVKDDLTEEQQLEKKAMDALINGKCADDDSVIPIPGTEDSFLRDVRSAPDAPSLAAYEATPIEGFGAALLRGMGWKEGDTTDKGGTKNKEIKKRPALLGIGAKPEAAEGIELGAWGSKAKGKRTAQMYNPVALRNRNTGEIITEEELKAKLVNQDMVIEEPEQKRRKYDDKNEDEKRRERRRQKRDDGYRYRGDKDRYRDRRRNDVHDGDHGQSDHKERDQDHDRDRRQYRSRSPDGRKEKRRERSRSPESRNDKYRARYRSRSRDSRRDRDRERDRRDRSKDSEDRRKKKRERDYEDRNERDEKKRRHRDQKECEKRL